MSTTRKTSQSRSWQQQPTQVNESAIAFFVNTFIRPRLLTWPHTAFRSPARCWRKARLLLQRSGLLAVWEIQAISEKFFGRLSAARHVSTDTNGRITTPSDSIKILFLGCRRYNDSSRSARSVSAYHIWKPLIFGCVLLWEKGRSPWSWIAIQQKPLWLGQGSRIPEIGSDIPVL